MKKDNYKYIVALFITLLFVVPSNLKSQKKDVTVILFENQSVRELSKRYFGNPNYWEAILNYNGLESVSDIKKGDKLKIPVGIVKETLKNREEAKGIIAEANKNGAKVLTPDLIKQTELKYKKLLAFEKENQWEKAYAISKEVLGLAKKSLQQAKRLRRNSADASISYVNGRVEKRKPRDRLWSNASKYSKLYEADRARTLSNSLAEITFIDLSRIRLNENSQALILHSRIDILKNKTETKVKLIKGDAFAYLLKSPKKKFDLDIPGVDAQIKSKSFWVEKESKATKIANYEGEIKLSVKDSVVVVKKNQGSIIPDGGMPSKPLELLVSPELFSPKNKIKVFSNNIEFVWENVPEANKYWFELAEDASFKKVIYSDKNMMLNKKQIKNLNSGLYYWHVASIDEAGFPGNFSNYYLCMVMKDTTKPYLTLRTPLNNYYSDSENVVFDGESEPNIDITINGKRIVTDSLGNFSFNYNLQKGENKVVVKAVDNGGNFSETERIIYYDSESTISNKIISKSFFPEESTFVTNNNSLIISGITNRDSYVESYFNGAKNMVLSDSVGKYLFLLRPVKNNSGLVIKIKTKAGESKEFHYKIWFDDEPPEIIINEKNKLTNKDSVEIIGKLLNGDSLFINSEIVSLSGNSFAEKIKLKEGENIIHLLGKDIAENFVKKDLIIRKDSTPPELLKTDIDMKENQVFIKVYAKDYSGLKKTARVYYSLNGNTSEEFLILNSVNEVYEGNIVFSKSDNIVIISVELEDYLNNKFIYKID